MKTMKRIKNGNVFIWKKWVKMVSKDTYFIEIMA